MKFSIPAALLVCAGIAYAAPVGDDGSLLEKREPVAKRSKWSRSRSSRSRSSTSLTSSTASADANATVSIVPLPLNPSSSTVVVIPTSISDSDPVSGDSPSSVPAVKPVSSSRRGSGGSQATSTVASSVPTSAGVSGSQVSSTASSSVPSSVAQAPGSIWQPQVAEPFQIVLSELPDPKVAILPQSVNVFDIDLFAATADTISAFHAQGKKIICYFSAGSSEDFRPDFKEFTAADQGNGIAKDSSGTSFWPGEKWLNIKNPNPTSSTLPNVWKIMQERIAQAHTKGCDAIDPDNMDGYNNNNGFGLTKEDSITYFNFLADEAAKYNIGIGLKNALEILPDVQAKAQFAVNEECAAFNECAGYTDFLNSKPVFHIEYVDEATTKRKRSNSPLQRRDVDKRAATIAALSSHCTPQNAPGPKFSTIIKTWDLSGWVQFCDGTSATTATTKS